LGLEYHPELHWGVKWCEIYEHLESVTDRCEDVADFLEGVTIKNADTACPPSTRQAWSDRLFSVALNISILDITVKFPGAPPGTFP
jgi:hypothetical protein